ncbi:hypothetical protein [Marinimicrobium locisalis]|uniref:hypothetical protein n=1 Tax=Marinimicrobium locisalis TaxID=546022 RepID=UPI0032217FFB
MKMALTVISVLVFIYGVVLIVLFLTFPFNYRDFDRNKNGLVGVWEIEYVLSYKERTVIKDGRTCIEYVSLKDGLVLAVKCATK